jgi:hypothetical protein
MNFLENWSYHDKIPSHRFGKFNSQIKYYDYNEHSYLTKFKPKVGPRNMWPSYSDFGEWGLQKTRKYLKPSPRLRVKKSKAGMLGQKIYRQEAKYSKGIFFWMWLFLDLENQSLGYDHLLLNPTFKKTEHGDKYSSPEMGIHKQNVSQDSSCNFAHKGHTQSEYIARRWVGRIKIQV